MPRAHNGAVELEYQTFGDGQPETIMLVNGLGVTDDPLARDVLRAAGLKRLSRHPNGQP